MLSELFLANVNNSVTEGSKLIERNIHTVSDLIGPKNRS